MRLVLAIAALAAILLALFGPAQDAAPGTPAGSASAAAPQWRRYAPAASLGLHAAVQRTSAEPHMPRQLHAVETAVRAARLHGAGENEIHRLRASQLPAAQVEALVAMENAEAHWRRRVADLRERCAAGGACQPGLTPEEQGRLRSYQAPALRQ